MEKISEYAFDATSNPITGKDYLDFSNSPDGGLTWDKSKKILVEEFVTYLNTVVGNLYNANGSISTNRFVGLGGNFLEFAEGNVIQRSDGVLDSGFVVTDDIGQARGSIGYDVSLDSGSLGLSNTIGTFLSANDGFLGVGNNPVQLGTETFRSIGESLFTGDITQNSGTLNKLGSNTIIGGAASLDVLVPNHLQATGGAGVGALSIGDNANVWMAMWANFSTLNWGSLTNTDITIYTNNAVRGKLKANGQFTWGFSTASVSSELSEFAGTLALRDTTTPAGNAGVCKIYSKDVAGTSKLFAVDGAGVETQLN